MASFLRVKKIRTAITHTLQKVDDFSPLETSVFASNSQYEMFYGLISFA
jgi:hypothetical protein